jgi:glycosyltransferase involved in cell wall biosynthesis
MSVLRIALLVGRADEGACGVRDYTHRLGLELRTRGVDAEVIETQKFRTALRFRPAGRIVHLHYPSVGEGRSLAPIAQELRGRPAVVTLHEFTHSHPARRAMGLALLALATRRVVTTEFERQAIDRVGLPSRPIEVIPVGSSLEPLTSPVQPVPKHLVYFGLLRADKGILAFLETATLLVRAHGWTAEVIGATAPGAAPELARLQRESDPEIRWTGALGSGEAAARIAASWCAYLPYPDGASERRSSLFAVLACSVPVITTEGNGTTSALRGAVLLTGSPADAASVALAIDRSERALQVERSGELRRAHEWATIAQRHLELYRSINR